MRPLPLVLAVVPILAQAACLDPSATVERRLERTFQVAAGSTVHVQLSGGRVTAETGPPGTVHVVLRQVARTNAGEQTAEAMLKDLEISATQDGNEVRLIGRRRRFVSWSGWGVWRLDHIQLSATVMAPADVRLDLDTSGGTIDVRGDRTAEVRADTSGGSIAVDGGAGPMLLNTSGGSIKVGRSLGTLHADTSGGSIGVDYIGSTARDIDLATSGGSIRVGLDPAVDLNVSAGTSGGDVEIVGVPFDSRSQGRSHASGTINGGTGRLRASTSGGSIRLRAAVDPGPSVNLAMHAVERTRRD
jgi:hypothetical protein